MSAWMKQLTQELGNPGGCPCPCLSLNDSVFLLDIQGDTESFHVTISEFSTSFKAHVGGRFGSFTRLGCQG